MKRSSIIRIRSHTAKTQSSPSKNPFRPYKIEPNPEKTSNETLITVQNPIKTNNTLYSSFNYENKTYESYLKNNNKRGLRSDDHFNKFCRIMLNSANEAKSDTREARAIIKEIENRKYNATIPKKSNSLNPDHKILNQKTFEKKIKNMSEKMNNKTTLLRINEVIRELFEEKKKTKKIMKYIDSHKLNNHDKSKAIRTSSRASKRKCEDSFTKSKNSNILENSENIDLNTPFIPKAVTKALDQLKNFIIDVPLLDEDDDEMNKKTMNISPIKENKENIKSSYFRKTSKILPGGQYNNEKHLKEDFKMFKGPKGNKLIRKFTDMADEEAHEKEMNYYLTLLRLKDGGSNKKADKNQVFDFNDELRRIYKREEMIRSHGKGMKRKFRKLKNEINEVDQKHFAKDKMDKLEIKIHKGLMNDYKKEKKKVITDIIEKMNLLKHKNTL